MDILARIVIASVVTLSATGIMVLAIRSNAVNANNQAHVRASELRKRQADMLETLKEKRKSAAVLLEMQKRSLKMAEANLESTTKMYSASGERPVALKIREDQAIQETKSEAGRIQSDIVRTEHKLREMDKEIAQVESQSPQQN